MMEPRVIVQTTSKIDVYLSSWQIVQLGARRFAIEVELNEEGARLVAPYMGEAANDLDDQIPTAFIRWFVNFLASNKRPSDVPWETRPDQEADIARR